MARMTWTSPSVTRIEPPTRNDERSSLESWLRYHRATLSMKCQGLTPEQLVQRPLSPSGLSLLGLVRHMAEVERSWFRRRFGDQPELGYLFCSDEQPDGDFDLTDPLTAQSDFATFAAEIELADQVTRGRSLEDTFRHPERGIEMDLRWVYTHLIEEYARHNGHADLIREQIDGATGE
jgi:uncharacterized damage-inducible protein DinB